MNVAELISQNKGTIVDVRTADEFRGGHVAGSINIPVQIITLNFLIPNLLGSMDWVGLLKQSLGQSVLAVFFQIHLSLQQPLY